MDKDEGMYTDDHTNAREGEAGSEGAMTVVGVGNADEMKVDHMLLPVRAASESPVVIIFPHVSADLSVRPMDVSTNLSVTKSLHWKNIVRFLKGGGFHAQD
jgi:hypothetical protein